MRALPFLLLFAATATAEPLILQGEVPEGGPDYFRVPFDVPAGVREVEVVHRHDSSENILDIGVEDPNGMRGWGGGNSEPAVIGESAASRSYVPGPLPAGRWNVIIGKAQIAKKPSRYHLEIELRAEPRLPAQPPRTPYAPVAPLESNTRWYTGDFHVHSSESGDAQATLDEIAELAEKRGLDFVALTEHNTVSQLGLIQAVQARHPKVLLVPSVEFTTYAGHATAFGATSFVDFRIGLDGADVQSAANAFQSQGALFTLAHPVMDLGTRCIGCAWKHPVPENLAAVEIASGGWEQGGLFFGEAALTYWDKLSAQGIHAAALGGSDDHRAGKSSEATSSPIGDPTTLVFARELSVAGLMEGIRAGRTVVKRQGPADPMLELDATGERRGDTVAGENVVLTLRVTGGTGHAVRWVKNGVPQPPVSVDGAELTLTQELSPSKDTNAYWRAEVLVNGHPRTVTSNLWVTREFPREPTGCGCGSSPGAALVLLGAAVLSLRKRERREVP